MRVALLHNSSAGSEDHDEEELTKVIRRAGHELVHTVRDIEALTAALHAAPCDLVVVAGGDGTVGRTACALSGWEVPISILPLGTANNTARSLDLSAHHEEAARSWHQARSVPFDIGLISDGSERRRFAEAVGWGIFIAAIVKAQRKSTPKSVRRTLKRDRKLFRWAVGKAEASDYRIEVDGRDVSGAYLLVEIMNVPLIGPRLPLSPESDPADGVFELVLASEEHRPALEELATTGSVTHELAPRIERGASIRVETNEAVMHCDGELWRHAMGSLKYGVDVQPGAVRYLVADPS
jgi:diacylglycerol kinase (ATP)